MTRLAAVVRLARRPGMKIRPSGKTLWVSFLAVALAACVPLGLYIHSLAPDLEIEGTGGFAPGFEHRLEERLTRTFTLNGLLGSTGSAVRDSNLDRLKVLDQFARGLDDAFRLSGNGDSDEGPGADSQWTHTPGSLGT